MMGRARVTLIEDGNLVRLRGWKVGELARRAGLRPTYSGVTGWAIDAKRLPELAAYLQYRNIAYTFEGATLPTLEETTTTPAPVLQAGLW